MIHLEPIKCPQCRAIPVDDKTPPGFYRNYGECHCEEETKEKENNMEKNFSVTVEVTKDGKVRTVSPYRGWGGQLSAEVIYYLEDGGCTNRITHKDDDTECPYLPDHHRHDYQSVTRILAPR